MVNVDKHIRYWRDSSAEDFAVARELVAKGRARHGLFFAHLALEKSLKAHVCRATGSVAPRIHDLVRLGRVADLDLTPTREVFLARFGRYQIEGRYPEMLDPAPTREQAETEMEEAEELLRWLTGLS